MYKVLSIVIVFSLLRCNVKTNDIYFDEESNTFGIFIDSNMYIFNKKDLKINTFTFDKGYMAILTEPINVRLLEDCSQNIFKNIKINKLQNYIEIISTNDCLNKNMFDNRTNVKFKKFNYNVSWDSLRVSSGYCNASKVFNFNDIKNKKYIGMSHFVQNYPFTVENEIKILMGTKGKLIYQPEIYNKSHAIPFKVEVFNNGELIDSFEYDLNFNFWLMSTNSLLMDSCNPEFD